MAESLIVRVAISGESLIVKMLIVSRGEFGALASERPENSGERGGEQCRSAVHSPGSQSEPM